MRQALGLDAGSFFLLGHSWGGILAIEHALRYQQHLKGLVISNMMSSIPAYNRYAEAVLMPRWTRLPWSRSSAWKPPGRPATRVMAASRRTVQVGAMRERSCHPFHVGRVHRPTRVARRSEKTPVRTCLLSRRASAARLPRPGAPRGRGQEAPRAEAAWMPGSCAEGVPGQRQPYGRRATPGRQRQSGRQRTVAATAPTKENQMYCSKLVRSSRATPTETAKGAVPSQMETR